MNASAALRMSSTPLWSGDDLRISLRAAGRELPRGLPLRAGSVLFRRGEPLRKVYVVMHGAVQVRRAVPEGQVRIVDLALAGDVVGFDDFASGLYAADAVALHDAVVCAIDPARWWRLSEHNPRLPALASLGAAQVHRALRQNMRLRLGAPSRLADCLLQLAEKIGSVDIELPLSYQDLANYLNLRPETMSRALRELERLHCLRRSGRARLQLDPDLLRLTRATPRRRQVCVRRGSRPA